MKSEEKPRCHETIPTELSAAVNVRLFGTRYQININIVIMSCAIVAFLPCFCFDVREPVFSVDSLVDTRFTQELNPGEDALKFLTDGTNTREGEEEEGTVGLHPVQ